MINYHQGCLFEYIDTLDKNKILIPHVVNNINKMGSGFVVPLYTRWPTVKSEYHEYSGWFCDRLGFFRNYLLGKIQIIPVSSKIDVINMFAQDGVISQQNPKPIKYDALANCLTKIKTTYSCINKQIVAPKFGAGLAGGDWNIIESMIKKHWCDFDVTICYKE